MDNSSLFFLIASWTKGSFWDFGPKIEFKEEEKIIAK